MMSKTHLAMGMAVSLGASFFIAKPQSLSDTLIALAGGAIGGVLADVDTVKNDFHCDALIGQVLGFAVLGSVAAIDYHYKLGVCEHVIGSNIVLSIIAGIVFFLLYIFGATTNHRTFTHSILAMVLFSGCFAVVYPGMGLAVLFGYASHLLLDLLNRKNVPLLYPIKQGICLHLFYADRYANILFMYFGFAATVAFMSYRLFPYIIH